VLREDDVDVLPEEDVEPDEELLDDPLLLPLLTDCPVALLR
jgi:hypothetical protein